MLEKTLESPLDCKIKPVNPKGKQPWIFIGQNYTKAEAPILWPHDAKSRLTGKDHASGKVWRQKKKAAEDEMVGWHHWLNGQEFEQTLGDSKGQESLVNLSSYVVSCFCSHSVMSDSATPWIAAYHAFLSFTITQSLLRLMSTVLMMPSNHLILCHSLLLLPSVFPSIRVFSSESAFHVRWPKY